MSCHSLLACRVSAERSAVNLIQGIPLYVICCFSLAAFNIFSLYLIFDSLIYMCLGMFPLGFILYGAHCASWSWLTISFPILGKFWTIISSNIFSDTFFFSSSSGTPIIGMFVHLMLSRCLWDCPQFFSFFFLYSILQQWIPPFCLPGHLSVLLPQVFCYWFLLENFKFHLLCCSSLFVCSLVLLGPC